MFCSRAELRSLSIPGTYQEKITHLGNSLMHLTALKSLDLSRNSLVSLEGIQHLVLLESLNLYYNCISSLAEVFRLHSLTELQDVDFRLNPVVKNESDYRLFVVHMLPKLRQLDDRPVRESERKASQLHFASEDSLDSKQSFSTTVTVGRPPHSRTRCADASAKKCLVMDADDEAVLNLIAECEWDLSNPPGSTSSSQKEHEADLHYAQESGHLLSPLSIQHQCGDSVRRGHEKKKGTSRGCCPGHSPQDQLYGELTPQHGVPESCHVRVQHSRFTPYPDSVDVEDGSSSSQKSTLSSQNILNPLPVPEKYRKRRMPGGRFQLPSDRECLSCLERPDGSSGLEDSLSRQDGLEGHSQMTMSHPEALEAEDRTSHGTNDPRVLSPKLCSAAVPERKPALEVALLEALLDLIDRCASGCGSLHGNEAFLAQARHVLSSLQEFTASPDSSALEKEDINYLSLENKSLQSRLAEQQQQYAATVSKVTAELNSSRRELDTLRQHLDKSLEENSNLKSLLLSVKKEAKNSDTSAALTLQITGLQASMKQLSGEVMELKQHLEHYDKIQELTQMLQESHSSLVSTNEHLLQELSRTRSQHRAEVEQMHWSFQEFKKTAALLPRRSSRLGGRQSC
ncbi:centrosomal protein of 72 kDa isoform X2 [Cricetulus griseus]|uniref:Centrosomal protein of 72 kDa n=1 Tax=Cricetulus griseus TaxID=10029 RepID=A0A9J7JEG7_CRIGR|nr:centrosomal protein of 72 kDa isoform X2 [Cricetulus griseus]XP_027255959.1 centrosomal protein of 72 kDa isoform X2 [Cricetulus griseus]